MRRRAAVQELPLDRRRYELNVEPNLGRPDWTVPPEMYLYNPSAVLKPEPDKNIGPDNMRAIVNRDHPNSP